MKYLFTIIFCAAFLAAQSQTKADSIQLVRQTVNLYDLDFTAAEADSMLESITDFYQLYKGLHRTLPANDIPYPFAFNPAPAGMKIATKKEKNLLE
ncbi:MAG: hypothetical protein IPK57_01515 [Chitinophagaceae bacterium]|nr:hypothetical protein [Chitinophagaceae bacterium]